MVDLRCKSCGHMLALPHGALASMEKNTKVSIWCVKCGRLNTVSNGTIKIGQKVNYALVKKYKDWEV